ncbi:MAG: hypothetical protein FJ086_11640, partial [Deltaproteobacteria bacterium]|nr:hypothetical protein [Deltaproteobacteria bacterium]
DVPVEPVAAPPPAGTVVARTPDAPPFWRPAVRLDVRASGQAASGFPVDSLGGRAAPSPLDTRFRIAPELGVGRFRALAEVDAFSGAWTGLPSQAPGYGLQPFPSAQPLELRQAFGEFKGNTWFVRVGQQVNQWGLGLLANSGARDAAAGDFGDARLGDLTWRALVAGRPLFGLGGAWQAVEPALAVDLVRRDNFSDFYGAGEQALQGVLALRFKVNDQKELGIYSVLRRQRAAGAGEDARSTDVVIVDAAGKWAWALGEELQATAGFEAVTIQGSTTQARTDAFPRHRVSQFGGAFKTGLAWGRHAAFFDGGFASGDQNPYDGVIQNFRAHPDFNAGFILFDQVVATQSARLVGLATDPLIVGVPQDGAQLLATRGSISGAAWLFPRLKAGVREWLDVYGGPMLAWTTAKPVDPYAARLNGGESLNSLGGRPGGFLGAELDVGVQARTKVLDGLLLSATAEAGVLLPGDGLRLPSGNPMGAVYSGRLRLSLGL